MPCNLLDPTGPYQLPTGWFEVTTQQYCALDAEQLLTVEARASYFAGRPIQVSSYVADCLAFLLTPPAAEVWPPYPADLGQETYLQVETIRALLVAQPLHACWGQVYGTLLARQQRPGPGGSFSQQAAAELAAACQAWPITRTYPAVAHAAAELSRLGDKYAELAMPDTTEAGRRAREAGSERLAMFGHLNVARWYAERFSTTISDIYQRPWEEIALYLYQDRINAEVLDNLTQQRHD